MKEVNYEVYFWQADKHQSFLLVGTIILGQRCQIRSTQSKKFAYLCNISRKTWRMKLIFSLLINTEFFQKLIVSIWMCVARHTRSTQNNKFAISLEHCKENVKDEVYFLPADKHQKFLKLILPFQVCVTRHVQITQNNKFTISS